MKENDKKDEYYRGMRFLDLEIPFPEIEGYSFRQIGYARYLKEMYIIENEDRFREIEEIMLYERDYRNVDYLEEDLDLPSFREMYSDEERCVLFMKDAGGIIAILNEWRERMAFEEGKYKRKLRKEVETV